MEALGPAHAEGKGITQGLGTEGWDRGGPSQRLPTTGGNQHNLLTFREKGLSHSKSNGR